MWSINLDGKSTNDPVGRPIKHKSSELQATGEATYIDDIPKYPNEAHAAFVLASVGNCELDTIDPSPAVVSLGPGLNRPYYASFYFCPI